MVEKFPNVRLDTPWSIRPDGPFRKNDYTKGDTHGIMFENLRRGHEDQGSEQRGG